MKTATQVDLLYEPKRKSPFIRYNVHSNNLSIKGNCTSLKNMDLFKRAGQLAYGQLKRLGQLQIEVFIDSINASNLKMMINMIRMASRAATKHNANLRINWFFDIENYDNFEIGLELKTLFPSNFNIIIYSD